jgi:hypothetical protein
MICRSTSPKRGLARAYLVVAERIFICCLPSTRNVTGTAAHRMELDNPTQANERPALVKEPGGRDVLAGCITLDAEKPSFSRGYVRLY